MKGRAIPYSADELSWLEQNRSMIIGDYCHMFNATFNRNVSENNLHSLRKRNGWKTGRTGCFVKGNEPHNKGKPCAPGKGGNHPNAKKTQFKKGNLPHNTRYLGHERQTKEGYIEVSVNRTNPHTGYERDYVLKHHYLWEQENGPLEDGYILKCLDGNKANTDPANWEPMPRATLPYLNGHRGFDYEAAAPEVRPSMITFAKLKHARKQALSKIEDLRP